MELLRELLDVLAVPVLEFDGFEADDVLATLARRGAAAGLEVELVTGDRDIFQCVADPNVRVLYTRRGITEVDVMDEAAVEARYGVRPERYVELAALRGDTSDNLPGVPGVGDKTAAKWLNKYGGLDEVFAHVAELTPKARENLAASRSQVQKNVEVMRLLDHVALTMEPGDLRIGAPDVRAVGDLMNALEFKGLRDRWLEFLSHGAEPGGATAEDAAAGIDVGWRRVGGDDLAGALAALGGGVGIARAGSEWAAASPGGEAVVWADADFGEGPVTALLGGDTPRFSVHGAKEVIARLARRGVDVRSLDVDTEVAAFLLDPGEGSYPVESLAATRLGVEITSPDRPQDQLPLGVAADADAGDLARRAWAVAALAPVLSDSLAADGCLALYEEVERPLARVLARMEAAGIRVDVAYLEELSAGLTGRIRQLEREIWDDAGEEFNVNSTPQLRRVLFEKLGLRPGKKTKTGFSTDAATLESLREDHPVVERLLEYRNLEKLRSTYTDALPPLVDPADGRIHTSFRQTAAATGRLSSENPNLMNIPIRTEVGRQIRRAFVPADGCVLASADYSQIELRITAHLSGDRGLLDAFASGLDVHTATAARVFGIDPEDVTFAHRSRAKAVNYGIQYGMQAWGLATRTEMSTGEAQEFIDRYFDQFPTLRAFMGRVVADARRDGYTTTILGRRRPIPELTHPNPRVRQMGERMALNAPIQGSAADIMKKAMIDVDDRLARGGFAARMLLQVHDELVLEVPEAERDGVGDLVVGIMERVVDLTVPLEVDLHFGDSWASAKG